MIYKAIVFLPAIGALIAGTTNKTALANPASVNLNHKLRGAMLFSFPRPDVS